MTIPHHKVDTAAAFAETLAKLYASKGGNVTDLFAAFVGVVVSEDSIIGLRCLEATDRWLSGSVFSSSV